MEAQASGDADPYLTALCYFNALRELGGARRIVEDEVSARNSRATAPSGEGYHRSTSPSRTDDCATFWS